MTTETTTKKKRTSKKTTAPAVPALSEATTTENANLTELANKWIKFNNEMNEYKKKAEDARTELLAAMDEQQVTTLEGLAYIATKDESIVDVARFSKLVSPEQFWSAVTVTQGKAKELLPSATVDTILIKVAGKRNVHKAK